MNTRDFIARFEADPDPAIVQDQLRIETSHNTLLDNRANDNTIYGF